MARVAVGAVAINTHLGDPGRVREPVAQRRPDFVDGQFGSHTWTSSATSTGALARITGAGVSRRRCR